MTGIDVLPQPHYPFPFYRRDAMKVLDDEDFLAQFSFIHASPPCHDHIRTKAGGKSDGTGWLLAATRKKLEKLSVPWVIENVAGAPVRPDYRLCGCQFGLKVRRERWFETSWGGPGTAITHDHSQPGITVYGHGGKRSHMRGGDLGAYVTIGESRGAMGISWMSTSELSQAIPPAYTEYIGRQVPR